MMENGKEWLGEDENLPISIDPSISSMVGARSWLILFTIQRKIRS